MINGTPIFVQIRQLLYSTIAVPICMLAPHKYKNVSAGILASTFFVFLFHLEGQAKGVKENPELLKFHFFLI
jgi:hypothetical protein